MYNAFRFWIQPDSGLPLDISSKFQINMALGDITLIENTEKFANMYLPLLWFDIVSILLILPKRFVMKTAETIMTNLDLLITLHSK